MVQKKRILLVSQDHEEQIRLEGILRVAGYDIFNESCADNALASYAADIAPERIDLVIASLPATGQQQLSQALHSGIFERLLRVQEETVCSEIYCINGYFGCLCDPAALLAAVKELLANAGRSSQTVEKWTSNDCPQEGKNHHNNGEHCKNVSSTFNRK